MFIDFVKRKLFWIAFIFLLFLFFVIFRTQTKADLVYFYPQNCLGSFVNPEKAQGEKEVNNPDLINESNSAVYYSGFKEIYCGNFQGPVKEGEIKKVTLHFNWVITKELREKPIIESTSSESLIEKIIPSKTIEINVATSDVPTLQNNTNSNESNNTNTNESQIATSSQIFKFINFVFAQEETQNSTNENIQNNTNTEEISTSTNKSNNANSSTSEISTTSQIETTVSESTSSSMEQTTSSEVISTQTTSIFATSSKTLFDIYYTLDGQNWNYLGSVNENNWQNLSFDIPVNNWLDISKIQIKINSLPDTDHYLYLESMWFEVEYENTEKEISETTTTKITTSTEQAIPISQEPLKVRKFEKIINVKNSDNLSCSTDQFSVNINEDETKFVNFKLSGEGIKNLEIGSLPAGIDIVFAGNNDYQISTNNDIVQVKIYRQKGSEKGNFSLPIIFSSKNSTIICQINIITN